MGVFGQFPDGHGFHCRLVLDDVIVNCRLNIVQRL